MDASWCGAGLGANQARIHPYGPYRMRHETVPCGGGTGFFKDKQGKWWCTYFGNDDQSPWREKPGLVQVEFAPDGRIQVAKKQPTFVLQP